MKREIAIELFEKRDARADHHRQNRVTNLISQAKPQTVAARRTTADEPDRSKGRTQSLVDEPRQVTRVELDRLPAARQVAMREDEGRRIAVQPPRSRRLEGE